MDLTRIVPALIAVPLLALAACGGDDDGGGSPTPTGDGPSDASGSPSGDIPRETVDDQTYFDNLTSTLQPINEESQELNDFRVAAFEETLSEEERAANAEEFAMRYEAFGQDAHDTLLAMAPGESLSGQHGALVDAMDGLADLGRDMASAFESDPVTTEQAFLDLFFELDGQSLELRVRDACFDLQTVATDQGIQTTIVCPR